MATKLILVRRRTFISVIPAYAGIHLFEPMRNENLDTGFRRHDGSGVYLMHIMAEAARKFYKIAIEVLWN